MKKNKFLPLISFLFQISIYAQDAAPPQRHHAIILIDRSASMRNSLCPDNLSKFILSDLKPILFGKGSVLPDRKLLEQGDYLSILSFGLNADAKNFDQFIPTDFGCRMRSISSNNQIQTLDEIDAQIKQIGCSSFANKSYGAYTAAIPAALYSLRKEGKKINRTFIITLTDGQFNAAGQQPRLELETIKTQIRGTKGVDLDIRPTLSTCYGLFESYSLKTGTPEQHKKRALLSFPIIRGKANMQIHEIIPNQRPLAIEALLRPDRAKLQFYYASPWNRRICEADLMLLYNVSANLQKLYRIDSIYAALTWKDRVIWQSVYSKVEGDIPLKIKIPSQFLDSSLKFNHKYWVDFTDDWYGLHILSPDGCELQGAEGLNRDMPIVLEIKQDRTWILYVVILGIVLLASLLFYLSRRKVPYRG